MSDSLLLPLALFALTLMFESPCGVKDAPMLAELNLFSVVVTLVFSPASRWRCSASDSHEWQWFCEQRQTFNQL